MVIKECVQVYKIPQMLICLHYELVSLPSASMDRPYNNRAAELEIIHRRFCKFALSVPRTTSNLACYGELGRYPLDITWKVTLIKINIGSELIQTGLSHHW